MNICIYGASSDEIDRTYIDDAFALGSELAKRGHSLVFGGGDKGLMGAAARGVSSAGGKITGVAPAFFDVDGVLYPHCTEMILTDTMRSRKQKMEELSDAFVMLPGGIGTFEEFFEIFTSKQLGRHTKAIAVLNTGGYYNAMTEMLSHTVSERFMKAECMELFRMFDNAADIVVYIERYVSNEAKFYK